VSEGLNRQLLRMGALLQLEQRVRSCSPVELPFVMVNETTTVIPYHQAVLWRALGRKGRVVAVSGLSALAEDGPYLTWLSALLRRVAAGPEGRRIGPVDRTAAGGDRALEAGWSEWMPHHAIWVPLAAGDGPPLGGLLLSRADPWGEAEAHLLDHLAGAFAQAWLLALTGRRRPPAGGWRKRAALAAFLCGLAGASLLPVRESVLAPAEVVPSEPILVRAPAEGVVDRIHVRPNEPVAAGQKLLSLDPRQIETRLKVAATARDIAQAEYVQTLQLAVADPEAKARLVVLEGKVQQGNAEVEYLRALLERVEVVAPAAGIAVFDDPNEWVGRPVALGERIMLVADPEAVELEIRLPVGEAMPLADGAEVALFLNVAPTRPVPARLVYASYRSAPSPDGTLAYRLRARFETGAGAAPERPRIGLKGTAKLFGERGPFLLWALRRPLAVVRQWLVL